MKTIHSRALVAAAIKANNTKNLFILTTVIEGATGLMLASELK